MHAGTHTHTHTHTHVHILRGREWVTGKLVVAVHMDKLTDKDFYEEVLVHEGAHASLDEYVYIVDMDQWGAAQKADCNEFISPYARDYPRREDIAESLSTYLGLRYYSDRLSSRDLNDIQRIIPNRIAVFDKLQSPACDLSPPLPDTYCQCMLYAHL